MEEGDEERGLEQDEKTAAFCLQRPDCRKTHTSVQKSHILHLRCSLCLLKSAAAQVLWALFRNLNHRVAYYRNLHSFRLTTAGRFALRASVPQPQSAFWALTVPSPCFG
mgnify:CR=1 FL=1